MSANENQIGEPNDQETVDQELAELLGGDGESDGDSAAQGDQTGLDCD